MVDVKKSYIVGFVLLLFIGAVSVYLAQTEFSVVSQSRVEIGEDGKPVWVINVAPTGPNEQVLFVKSNDVDSYEANGSAYIPQSDFSISFTPTQNYCEYSLVRDSSVSDSVKSFFSGVFGQSYEVYRLSVSPESNVNVRVSPSKGDEKVINLANPNQVYTFNDENDGRGTVQMQTLGTYEGLTDCPDGGDVAIQYFEDGTYEFVGLEQETGGVFTVREERSDFARAFRDVEVDVNDRTLRGHKSKDFAIGSVLLFVDAEYFDARYIPPSIGKPEIVDTQAPGTLEEGRASGTSVIIENVGNGDGRFKINAETDNGYISPSSQSVDIEQGDTREVSFNLIAGEVDDNEEAVVSYEVCSVNLFSENYCVSEGIVYEIAKSERVLQGDDCGNGQCEPDIGENAVTCPSDCTAQPRCGLEHESLYQGTCECDPGYEYKEDPTGREYCGSIDTTPDWVAVLVIVVVFMFINGMMVLIYRAQKK